LKNSFRRVPLWNVCGVAYLALTWTRLSPHAARWDMLDPRCESNCGFWIISADGLTGTPWHFSTCTNPSSKVTPHVLRHTAAMQLLQHGIDRSVIALWLGHESVETTQMYLHADLRLKEEALAKMTPLDAQPGRFRPDDQLLAFLESL
jgi:integrase